MIPRHPEWSCLSKPLNYPKRTLPRPVETFGEVFKVKVGPDAIGDSQGVLTSRFWICYQLDGAVLIRSAIDDEDWSAPVELFEEAEQIEHLDFSFDQLGREVVFYQVGTELRLWFFDSSALPPAFVKEVLITDGSWPTINFDIIDNTSNPMSDVILCYVKAERIYQRIQRDRFAIEYSTPATGQAIKILSCGMSEQNRFQIIYNYQDARDGGNRDKVYETTGNVFSQLRFNNLEIGFTIQGAPSDCELKANLKEYYTILANFGFINGSSSGPENNEQSLLMRFLFNEFDSSVTVQILRDPAFEIGSGLTGAYYVGTFEDFRFSDGDYILRFTQLSTSPTLPTKRLELIKDGDTIIDEEVFDFESRDGGFFSPSAINKLRFGAYAEVAFPTATMYEFSYPVRFFNMYAIFNGTRTDWPVDSVAGVESVPAGNPMVVKRKDSNQLGWSFAPVQPKPLP